MSLNWCTDTNGMIGQKIRMTNDDFKTEDFEVTKSNSVLDRPLEEGETGLGVILASERLEVRHYEGMTIQDALAQINGRPEGDKFRVLLDGKISSLESIIENSSQEVIFVGNWTLGNEKKTN